ncbi:MAG: DUF3796 domain-containing protein [Psychrobacillus sp.]|uniref:DUF3796 domain-containing protein n=1 Tax=Psychrobacillus sp. MER TA 171 TaxID=2939577 RepID=UPI00204101E9|nr:DUF3796 domain-containing protein [Psychrobacillus sp. MER TA 171]MCM3359650.1 DUF3796 domain-containing protein [Psychrobacillus sp. MER TA 171]
MNAEFDWFTFLIGIPTAIVIMGITFFVFRRIGKKKRLFDERYNQVHSTARSFSWKVTTAAILVAWMIIIIVEGPGLAFFVMTGLWVIHIVSYGVGAAVADKNN